VGWCGGFEVDGRGMHSSPNHELLIGGCASGVLCMGAGCLEGLGVSTGLRNDSEDGFFCRVIDTTAAGRGLGETSGVMSGWSREKVTQ
jgi:hypothetical protein